MTLKGALRLSLVVTFAIAAFLLILRAWMGPFALVRTPLNVEAIAAVSVLLLWALSGVVSLPTPCNIATRAFPDIWPIAAIVAVVAAAFWRSLSFPLIFDDYVHLPAVLHATSSFWIDQWTIPAVDHFFRPLGMYDYRLEALLAGHSDFLWRLGNLVWHCINSVLVYFLARRLGLISWAALVASLLFSVHGSRPESAAWVAGRFDLLATFFVLVSLLCLYRASDSKHWVPASAALLFGVAALLSKEAAYIWPLLVTLLFWSKLPRRLIYATYGLTAATFLYRWLLLNGIGGYQTGAQPDIYTFSFVRTVKALVWRLWATLWFPINWTHEPGWILSLAILGAALAMGWLAWNRANLHWRALAFVWIASLPVQHLLLIGQDMEKSRVLYLPSVGFAILVAFALQSVPNARGAMLAGTAIIAFQLTALQHNLNIVGPVTKLGRDACAQVGQVANSSGGVVSASGLPKLRDGVYFLGNGFPQCVEWQTGVAADRIRVIPPTREASKSAHPALQWDESAAHFVPAH